MKFFEFHNPWLLLLAVPALALVLWRRRRKRAAAAILFPSVARLKGFAPTLRQRTRAILPILETLALLGLVGAVARPRQGDARTVVRSEGIAIEMVLDRSSSMDETMRYGGVERKRIDIVKEVFADFISGGKGLTGRRTDLVGLTTFARFTEESCPLINPHEPLLTSVKNLRTVAPALDKFDQPTWNLRNPVERQLRQNPLNATAIGDGLQRAVLSLITAEEDLKSGEAQGAFKIKGKVAILLTDGENNAGDVLPAEAGQYAAANGIKVYFIVFNETTIYRQDFFGNRRAVGEQSEEEVLKDPREVVTPSGGKAYLARSGEELRDIYEQIDKLERSEIGKIEYRSYQERFHWFLLPALAFAVAAVLLGETVFRGIP